MTPDRRIALSRGHGAGLILKATIRRNQLRWCFMENVWVMAAVWVGLALIGTLAAIWFRISTALSEIVVGTVAQLVIGALFVHAEPGGKTSWISFLAGTGAIVLTFLAGAELDPQIFRTKWKEVTVIGLVGFFGPFFGCTALPTTSCIGLDDRVGWRASPSRPLRCGRLCGHVGTGVQLGIFRR
jgi:sodium/hydrogen exchanger family protein